MDQLELLKKDWKSKESHLPKLSKDDISKLILKKSSSIVKWIFIISILEFLLPHAAYLFIDYGEATKHYNKTYIVISTIITYSIAIYFIYLFYKNYSSISASNSTKELISSILKTRRTVKFYIWYTLTMVFIMGLISIYFELHSDEYISTLHANANITLIYIMAVIFLIVLIGLLWLFYQLIYGILLRKLNKNYKELLENGL